jgi:hypothetical protein
MAAMHRVFIPVCPSELIIAQEKGFTMPEQDQDRPRQVRYQYQYFVFFVHSEVGYWRWRISKACLE